MQGKWVIDSPGAYQRSLHSVLSLRGRMLRPFLTPQRSRQARSILLLTLTHHGRIFQAVTQLSQLVIQANISSHIR